MMKVISVDLLSAAKRSSSFPKDWSESRMQTELARYERFLLLAKEFPGQPLAPTREIDEFWHLHMLSPMAYHTDCMQLFGEVLDHDGGFGLDPSELPELQRTFEATARAC